MVHQVMKKEIKVKQHGLFEVLSEQFKPQHNETISSF